MSVLSKDPLIREGAAPRTTQAAEGLRRRRFTVAEITAFVEHGLIDKKEGFELIGGEIVPMSPKGLFHERLKTALMIYFVRALPPGVLVSQETTFYLSEDTFLGPDFVFYDEADGLEKLNGETCLLAVEVADSSLSYDRGRKANLYASFGVKELWVVDVRARSIRVFRNPTPTGYANVVDIAGDAAVTALNVLGLALKLASLG